MNELKLPSQIEMQAMDRDTINAGVSSLQLMEKAGCEIAKKISAQVKSNQKILIFCGPGNNGGDGLVVARYLSEAKYAITVIITAAKKYSSDFLSNLKKLSSNISLYIFGETNFGFEKDYNLILDTEVINKIKACQVIIDALLGTGQKEAPAKTIKDILLLIESSVGTRKKIAVDIPTGINPDTGEVFKNYFKADSTISVQLFKRGMLQYPAKKISGELQLVDIGIDTSLDTEFSLLTESNITKPRPRKPDAHKGDFGEVIVLAGSKTMPGSVVLSAEAALVTGAGLVKALSFSNSNYRPEIIHLPVKKDYLDSKSFTKLIKNISLDSFFIIGPGLGTNKETAKIILNLLEKKSLKVVIDADALNIIASQSNTKKLKLSECILTPHPGEMARLLKCKVSDVQKDRYQAVKKLANQHKTTVVLKGASTVIYSEGKGYVNTTGNPYMAQAGCGDVLSGIIAAYYAQGLSSLESACLGVYKHGLIGDIVYKKNKAVVTASCLIKYLCQ